MRVYTYIYILYGGDLNWWVVCGQISPSLQFYRNNWPRQTHEKGGDFSWFEVDFSFSCLPFSALVFLLLPLLLYILKLKLCPPSKVIGTCVCVCVCVRVSIVSLVAILGNWVCDNWVYHFPREMHLM